MIGAERQGRSGGAPTLRWVVLVATCLVSMAAPVDAQRGGERSGGPQDRAELERRFRAQMARMIQDRLELDDEGAARLSDVTAVYEQRRRELRRAEYETRRSVETLVERGDASTAEARALLDRMTEPRRQENDLFEEEQAALLEVITPVQLLELHALREEIGRRIREMRRRGRGDRHGPEFDGPFATAAPDRSVTPVGSIAER